MGALLRRFAESLGGSLRVRNIANALMEQLEIAFLESAEFSAQEVLGD